MPKSSWTKWIGVASLLICTVVGVNRVEAQSGSSFGSATYGGGLKLFFSTTGHTTITGQILDTSSGWTDYTTILSSANVNKRGIEQLSNSGKGYYVLGFDYNAPPAYVQLNVSAAGLGNSGDKLEIQKIGGFYLYDASKFTTATPTSTEPRLYQAITNPPMPSKGKDVTGTKLYPSDPKSTTIDWVKSSLSQDKTYFGYTDANNSFFSESVHGQDYEGGDPHPKFGQFNFASWTVSKGNIFIGLDVSALNKRTNTIGTGRIYLAAFDQRINPNSVPEPIFYQLGGLLVLGGGTLLRWRRKRLKNA